MRTRERSEFEDTGAVAGERPGDESNAPAPLTIGRRGLLLVLGLWTLFGLLQASTWMLGPVDWAPWRPIAVALVNAYLWVPLTPPILRLAARPDPGPGRRLRRYSAVAALEVWASDSAIAVVDGLAFLADGALYVNTSNTGRLFRIPVNADGSAGALVPIETSMPLVRPDGLRTAGPRTLLQAEQQGRVAELTISGNRAAVRVVQEGLARASGVTLVGDAALVLVELARAVVVPYRPR